MSWPMLYFRLVAIVLLVFGIVAAIAPDEYLSLLGVDGSAGGRLWGRGFGAAAVGLGVIFLLLDIRVGRESRIAAIGAAVTFGITAVTDAFGTVTGDFSDPVYGWVFTVFNILMAGLALRLLRQARDKAAQTERIAG